jgi:hypothetical protein
MLVFDLVVIAMAISLEPIPFTAFALVLASARGIRKGAAFIVGWILSLVTVVALTLLVTGNHAPRPGTAPSHGLLVARIVIGLALVAVAFRRRRRMQRPKTPKDPPKWQARVDGMSPLFALVLAVLVQPWGLVAAGVAVIADAELTSWQSSLALLFFCLLSAGTYLAVEIYAIVRPERAQARLVAVRSWITGHTDQVIIGIALVVGLWLIADSIWILAT